MQVCGKMVKGTFVPTVELGVTNQANMFTGINRRLQAPCLLDKLHESLEVLCATSAWCHIPSSKAPCYNGVKCSCHLTLPVDPLL